jgi:hypothetical protein
VKEKTNLEIVSYNDLNPISQVEVQPCDVEWFFNISYDKDAQMSVNVSNEMPEMYVDENAEDSQEPC